MFRSRVEVCFALLTLLVVLNSADQAILTTSPKFPWIQRFTSIGDSYSAGLGSGSRLDWSCSRYSSSYPHILHSSLLGDNVKRTHQFLSCSGATSTEILEKQIPALQDDLDLLTISAGGNDIGLTPILSNCIYQFYMSDNTTCQQAIDNARALIANKTQLYKNVTALLSAAQPKMKRNHGLIYYTGYASFFGTDDTTCDNVTWAVWRTVERSKPYLSLQLRLDLNDLVHSVNSILRKAVAAAGPNVHFIDYDPRIAAARGRYCESGVVEPAPNRRGLAFYEWSTVDSGEDRKDLQNRTGGDVPKGSFESGIARDVNKALEEHPNLEFDPEKGFVNRTRGGVGRKGVLEDTIHWLLPDSYKRVFHMRPEGHGVVARMVVEDLEAREYGRWGGEVEEL